MQAKRAAQVSLVAVRGRLCLLVLVIVVAPGARWRRSSLFTGERR
jgi:hypothetical protein